MWVWLWVGLVVAAGVGAFFVGRSLWRSVKGLGREAARASDVLAQASARAQRVGAELAAAQPSTAPTLFDDPIELRGHLAGVRANGARLRAARRRRDALVWARWRRFNE